MILRRIAEWLRFRKENPVVNRTEAYVLRIELVDRHQIADSLPAERFTQLINKLHTEIENKARNTGGIAAPLEPGDILIAIPNKLLPEHSLSICSLALSWLIVGKALIQEHMAGHKGEKLCIGIAHGDVSLSLLEPIGPMSALGIVVNLASRLLSYAKRHSVSIIATEEIVSGIEDKIVSHKHLVDPVEMGGYPIECLYEVVPALGSRDDNIGETR